MLKLTWGCPFWNPSFKITELLASNNHYSLVQSTCYKSSLRNLNSFKLKFSREEIEKLLAYGGNCVKHFDPPTYPSCLKDALSCTRWYFPLLFVKKGLPSCFITSLLLNRLLSKDSSLRTPHPPPSHSLTQLLNKNAFGRIEHLLTKNIYLFLVNSLSIIVVGKTVFFHNMTLRCTNAGAKNTSLSPNSSINRSSKFCDIISRGFIGQFTAVMNQKHRFEVVIRSWSFCWWNCDG